MLKKLELQNIIKESLEDYPINKLQEKQVEDMFFSLMKETKNKDKDKDLQESLVTAIMHDVATKDVPEKILGRYGDNAHMRFFDDFLEEGVTGEIMSVFKKHGIPTGVLRGVKKGQPIDITTNTDAGSITVKTKISPSPTGEEEDDYLSIYKDGVLIYEWKRDVGFEFDEDEYEDEYSYQEKKSDDLAKYAEMQATKTGVRRKNLVFRKEVTPEDTYTYEYARTKKGTPITIVRDSKGRFAKR